MTLKPLSVLTAATLFAATVLPATAEDLGRAEYEDNCLACHGVGGAGDGPLSDMLTVKVPPLTGLAAANEGKFPMLEAIMVIDGRTGVRAHGGEMPIWGERFKKEFSAAAPYGDEILARGRILSLAYYLETIQQ